MNMTRKEFWQWMALCPAKEGKSGEAGWFVAEDNGTEIRVFFWFDEEDHEDELELSDYERGWIECESQRALEVYRNDMLPCGEEDYWHGFQLGDRMFDINIWSEQGERPLPLTIYCSVYECQKSGDNWTTDTSKYNSLWRIEDDNA